MSELKFHDGERISFKWPGEHEQVYTGIIRGHFNSTPPIYRVQVLTKGGSMFVNEDEEYHIGESLVRGVISEPSPLVAATAERFIKYPGIRMVHERDGVRFILHRRDENDVGHVDMSCERWPRNEDEDEQEDAPAPIVTFGTVTGLIGAKEVLLSLQILEDQMKATMQALLAGKQA